MKGKKTIKEIAEEENKRRCQHLYEHHNNSQPVLRIRIRMCFRPPGFGSFGKS
jgi:hypothetical protein